VISFVVEQAGCASCGRLVTGALEPFGTVRRLEIDQSADTAQIVLAPAGELSQATVDSALAAVSAGAGHTYRVRPGSWRRSDDGQ
jgi:hypothetical protein